MRNRLLAGASVLALFAWDPAARATSFDYTGSLVPFTVPVTGTYRILAFGAQGGFGGISPVGLGAEIGGEFSLTAGEVLQIAVGGSGADGAGGGGGGGGGGSFVVGPGNAKQVIAGGGGGSAPNGTGGDGLTGGDGGTPNGSGGGGGTNGSGGGGGSSGGGGGFGGGGGGTNGIAGGGGGGGGSFDAGLNQILMAGVRSGDGEVVITFMFAGTPGAANCLGKSVSALASKNGGLSHAAAALEYPSVQALQDAISAYCADVPGPRL